MYRCLTLAVVLVILTADHLVAVPRTWTSSGGRFSKVAEFVRLDAEKVVLQTDDGLLFSVPMDGLSDADQEFVADNYGPDAEKADKELQTVLSELERVLAERELDSMPDLLTRCATTALSVKQHLLVHEASRFAAQIAQFWAAFDATAKLLQPGHTFTLAGKDAPASLAKVISREQETIVLELGSNRYRLVLSRRASLPSDLAVALAKRALPSTHDGMKLLESFLRIDPPDRDQTRWREAAETPVAQPEDVGRPRAPSLQHFNVAAAELREMFKEDYAAARLPSERLQLAKLLFEKAGGIEHEDPSGYYVMMRESASILAELGRFDAMRQILDSLDQRYRAEDRLRQKAELIERSCRVAKADDEGVRLIHYCFQLAEDALRADDYITGSQLLDSAGAAANMLRDRTLKPRYTGEVAQQKASLRRMRSQLTEVETALQQLSDTPEDRAASLKVGRFYCFFKRQWDKGLPHLSRGDDPDLARNARLDLAQPTQPANQLDVGHRWWTLSEQQSGALQRDALQERAVYWYRQAQPALRGRDRLAIERRLEQYRDSTQPADPAPVSLTSLEPLNTVGVALRAGETLYRRNLMAGGRPRDRGVWAQPDRTNGATRIEYELNREYLALRGTIAYDDAYRPDRQVGAILFEPAAVPGKPARGVVLQAPGGAAGGPLRWNAVEFRIVTDKGKVLWVERLNSGETRDFNVPVGNADRIYLVTACNGPHTHSPAVWIDPMLVRK